MSHRSTGAPRLPLIVICCGPLDELEPPELVSESDGNDVVGVAEGSDSVVLTFWPS